MGAVTLVASIDMSESQPGDVVHVLGGVVVGIDRGDERIRLTELWGTDDNAVAAELVQRFGWSPDGLSAAGAYVAGRRVPAGVRDPAGVAWLRDRPGQFDGLRGARPGRYALTYHYDRVSAYPAIALGGIPDWTGWTEMRAIPRYPAAGYVLLADEYDTPIGVVREWMTLDEYHYVASTYRALPYRRVYATPIRHWGWLQRAVDELLAIKLGGGPFSGPAKRAINGIIGRFAARAGYQRWFVGRTGPVTRLVRTRHGYLTATVVDCSRHRPRLWSLTHYVVARQRVELARLVAENDAVWWYVDAITTTAPLRGAVVGQEVGEWRILRRGASMILDWRGGEVAGAIKLASIPRALASRVLSDAAAAVA